MRHNEFGQPIGDPVEAWTTRPRPPRTPMEGRYCRVEPLDLDRHAVQLHAVAPSGVLSNRKRTAPQRQEPSIIRHCVATAARLSNHGAAIVPVAAATAVSRMID